jgi:hypothetical protein
MRTPSALTTAAAETSLTGITFSLASSLGIFCGPAGV